MALRAKRRAYPSKSILLKIISKTDDNDDVTSSMNILDHLTKMSDTSDSMPHSLSDQFRPDLYCQGKTFAYDYFLKQFASVIIYLDNGHVSKVRKGFKKNSNNRKK